MKTPDHPSGVSPCHARVDGIGLGMVFAREKSHASDVNHAPPSSQHVLQVRSTMSMTPKYAYPKGHARNAMGCRLAPRGRIPSKSHATMGQVLPTTTSTPQVHPPTPPTKLFAPTPASMGSTHLNAMPAPLEFVQLLENTANRATMRPPGTMVRAHSLAPPSPRMLSSRLGLGTSTTAHIRASTPTFFSQMANASHAGAQVSKTVPLEST